MLTYEVRRNGARIQRVPVYTDKDGKETTFTPAIKKNEIENTIVTLPDGRQFNCTTEFRQLLERKLSNMTVLDRVSAKVWYNGVTVELSIQDIKFLIAFSDLHEEEIEHE